MKKSGVFRLLVILILIISMISFVSLVSAESNETETNETEADNETETEECAASITVNFNQDVYYSGDFFKITVEVFDSQGNRIPNVLFYISTYLYSEDRWGSPSGSETTNEQGYHEHSDSALIIVESGKFLYKFHTEETSFCNSVEDTVEIEFIKEETEEEAEEEPEPDEPPYEVETCAASIKITLDKDVYYYGDYVKVRVEIVDAEGNGLANYPFRSRIFTYGDGLWHTGESSETGEDGLFINNDGRIEKGKQPPGKIRLKVTTAPNIKDCGPVEDTVELEIREGEEESEPVPCGIGTCIPEEEEEPIEIPEDEILYSCTGCELEGKCYPMGYRKAGQYCSEDYEFVEQLDEGVCDNHFECESNVCISGECVGEGLMKRIIKWFRKLFGIKPKPPEVVTCSKLLIEKDIGDYEYFISEYGHAKESQVPLYSEDGEQIDIVKCCVAGYLEPDGEAKGTAGVVCPFDNREDVENTLYWLSNKGEITLGEYKGQEVYGAGNAIIWIHKDFILAAGTDPKATIPLPEKIINAYLKKYPNDLEEIEIPEEPVVGGPCSYDRFKGECKITSITDENVIKFRFTPSEPLNLEDIGWVEQEEDITDKEYEEYAGYLGLDCLNIDIITKEHLENCGVREGEVFGCDLKLITTGTCTPMIFDFYAI